MTHFVRKMSVLLREDDYGRFERYCSAKGFKKSTLAARLIKDYLTAEGYGTNGAFAGEPARTGARSDKTRRRRGDEA